MVNSDRFIAILTGCLCLALSGCKDNVEYSEAPFPGIDKSESKPVRTTVFAGLPIDMTTFQVALDQAVPERLLGMKQWLRRAACYERRGRTICQSAQMSGTITRDGAIAFHPRPDGVAAVIPVKADFSAKGRGRAAGAGDAIVQHFNLHIPFAVTLDEKWRPKVTIGKLALDKNAGAVQLFGRDIKFIPLLQRNTTRYLRQAVGRLQASLADQNFAELGQKIWRRLYDPMLVSDKPEIWLRARPLSVSFGGILVEDNKSTARLAFATSMHTYFNERPVPLMPLAMPPLTTRQTDGSDSQINLRMKVSYEELRPVIADAFPEDEIEIGDDQENISVTAHSPELYASRRFLALKLGVEADLADSWFSEGGHIYYTALPWFDAEKGLLTVNHVALTQPRTRPRYFRDGKFLFAKAPYAKKFKKSVALDLNERFEKLLAQANVLTSRKLDKTFWLNGRFREIGVNSISPRYDHLQLNLRLRGTLSLQTTPPPQEKPAASTRLSEAGRKNIE